MTHDAIFLPITANRCNPGVGGFRTQAGTKPSLIPRGSVLSKPGCRRLPGGSGPMHAGFELRHRGHAPQPGWIHLEPAGCAPRSCGYTRPPRWFQGCAPAQASEPHWQLAAPAVSTPSPTWFQPVPPGSRPLPPGSRRWQPAPTCVPTGLRSSQRSPQLGCRSPHPPDPAIQPAPSLLAQRMPESMPESKLALVARKWLE